MSSIESVSLELFGSNGSGFRPSSPIPLFQALDIDSPDADMRLLQPSGFVSRTSQLLGPECGLDDLLSQGLLA